MAVLRDGKTTKNQPKTSSGNPSGVNKPPISKTKAPGSQGKNLQDRRLKVKAQKDARQKDLEGLKQKLDRIKSDLESPETSEESKLQIEESLKNMITTCKDIEEEVTGFESDLMEIDSDLREIENGKHSDPMEDVQNEEYTQPVIDNASVPTAANGTNDNENSFFFSQSKPDIKSFVDEETPTSWADFPTIDLTKEEDSQADLLGEGKTLLTTNRRGGKLYVNSYGPKNSAMLTWTSAPGASEGENVTNILSKNHRWAMDTDDDGHFIYKGKIAHIKGIAWLPKKAINNMRDLLNSVKELDPVKKIDDPKYRFPFSTVLVGWKDVRLPPACINRSNYKYLTSSSKEASKRTDRKFYEIACLQVTRYTNWAGEDRLARDKSPSPLEETPEPEERLQNQNGQNQGSQNQGGQKQNGQNQNGQNQNGQNQNDQKQNGQNQQPSNNIPSENEQGNPKMPGNFTFNRNRFIEDLFKRKGWDKLSEEEQMKKEALAQAQYDIYRQKMIEQGAKEVEDN